MTRGVSNELRDRALKVGDARSSLRLYRAVRKSIQTALFPYLRVRSRGTDSLDLPGPTILAPVHRSHLDSILVASLSDRRIRALAKESLFTTRGVGYVCAALGAIPVRRGKADKEALLAAKMLLDRGEAMIVFPEGGRQAGHGVAELFDGAAWLAARTEARVIPVGISGTAEALGEGSRRLRRVPVAVVVGEPLDAPTGLDGARAKRDDLAAFTQRLAADLSRVQDEARDLAAS